MLDVKPIEKQESILVEKTKPQKRRKQVAKIEEIEIKENEETFEEEEEEEEEEREEQPFDPEPIYSNPRIPMPKQQPRQRTKP